MSGCVGRLIDWLQIKTWRVWQLSSSDNIGEAMNTVKSKSFDCIIEKDEGNKALMRIIKNQSGDTRCEREWRYYTRFFYDLVRK